MNGAGNRFIFADLRDQTSPLELTSDQVRDLARAHDFDQLLLLETSTAADAFMRIWNCDGAEVEACGNGTRAAAWAMMQSVTAEQVTIDTQGGLLRATRPGEMTISVDMGQPALDWRDIPTTHAVDTLAMDYAAEAGGVRVEQPGAVNMGNPHAVFFVSDAEAIPLDQIGPRIETDPLFPEKINASFAQILDREHIRLRVWERGAGITAACGTAACATLVAAARRDLTDREATIHADGGDLQIAWRTQDNHVVLTGPVEDEGPIDIEL
ncbi:MAG: diaminopimelate epimerase [Alphaproteobacteria bacterium]|nr:diaminopimelate epimerase [Alphaproteobacteria bacterium]